MPRFVLLHHRTPPHAAKPDHYDLMLEDGDVLKTFTLWQLPDLSGPVTALADFDHRLAYLDYEGPVSNDRGEVAQADAGTFAWIIREKGRIEVELSGRCFQGVLKLELQEDPSEEEGSDSTTSV
ncbi:DNA polymerase ligase N-terminal domain-containing protein [Blastopirellula marina]|nr:DNA polymerase ligase N-terminal domain-containing protein [Blastopirellula marina]